MLLRLIDDMSKALEHDCYFSALAIALMLPDICGKAKYPIEKSTKKRYIDWYDEYVGQYEKFSGNDAPYLSGEVVYKLRCAFLHQGNPNIEKESISDEICKIDHFSLLLEKKNKFDLYSDSASVSQWFFNDKGIGSPIRNYQVSVRRLCMILAACANGYYRDHSEQFDFFEYDIVSPDEKNSEEMSD